MVSPCNWFECMLRCQQITSGCNVRLTVCIVRICLCAETWQAVIVVQQVRWKGDGEVGVWGDQCSDGVNPSWQHQLIIIVQWTVSSMSVCVFCPVQSMEAWDWTTASVSQCQRSWATSAAEASPWPSVYKLTWLLQHWPGTISETCCSVA